MLAYSGVKAHACSGCEKWFGQANSFKRLMIIHAGENYAHVQNVEIHMGNPEEAHTHLAGTSESVFLKFEKWKVKIKSFHSFSRSAKWKKNTFTLFREVQSEIKMLSLFFKKWKVKSKCFEIEIEKWKFSRILNNSRETRFFNRFIPWQPNKTAETDGLSVG